MVSVIIPVYKVEKYIDRCARSLFEQTFTDMEYIFVDDCSPDKSIAILKAVVDVYPYREKQVKIISHECNRGLAVARNTGLKYATGEYVLHCDSDDYVEADMIEKMYRTAKRRNADIVWCDYLLSFAKRSRYMVQPDYSTAFDALNGLLSGKMKYNVWNKLVKRSLYDAHSISFPEGHNMGEDMTMIRLFACTKKIAYLHEAFYHYVQLNGNAYTNNLSKKNLDDIVYNTEETVSFLCDNYGYWLNDEIAYFKLSVKFPLLISDSKEMYRLWSMWFPEANKYILSNKSASLRSRLLQLAAAQKQFWIVSLYYKFVHKFVYGIVYR